MLATTSKAAPIKSMWGIVGNERMAILNPSMGRWNLERLGSMSVTSFPIVPPLRRVEE
jgi:hypothetical protein